jgi:hypothetical protein
MESNPLIGTWRLVSWENRRVEDDEVSYPLGKDAEGYIMYNPDGYMFVAIMSPYCIKFAGGDLLSGTREEEAKAEESVRRGGSGPAPANRSLRGSSCRRRQPRSSPR